MASYVLSCCSTVDLPEQILIDRDIRYIYFHFQMDGVDYPDDFGKTMPFDEFFRRLSAGADAKSSQVNAQEFEDYFRAILDSGKDVLHVCLSSGISGVMNSACAARDLLQDQYPDRKIIVLDSLNAAGSYGLLMQALADRRDEGMTIDEAAKWCEDNRLKAALWFFSYDLTFFIKGGRISKTAGFFGKMLQVCPLMSMDTEGRLTVVEKIRTKKKAMATTLAHMEQDAINGHDYNDRIVINESACRADAEQMAAMIAERFPKAKDKIVINSFGTTIGCHTGPGTIAVFFWSKPRT